MTEEEFTNSKEKTFGVIYLAFNTISNKSYIGKSKILNEESVVILIAIKKVIVKLIFNVHF